MSLQAEIEALVENQPRGESTRAPRPALPALGNDPGKALMALVLLKLSEALRHAEEQRTKEREQRRPHVEFNLD